MGGLVSGALEVMAEQCTGRGVRGVVAAAAPLAAALGAEALRAGGNAYDAAVTAALAETVLLPPKCGLAGDLVAFRVTPGGAPEALLAIGGAAAGLAAAARDGLPVTGALAVGVPGAPAGYAALAEQGTFSLEQLVAPAVAIARDGFVWSQICTSLTVESRDLLEQQNPAGTVYLPAGEPIAPGAVVRLPGLADVLDGFAERGAALFSGPIGDAVVDAVRRRGGVLRNDDFAFGSAEWAAPVERTVGGRRMWATPAPTHGPSLLDAMHGAQPGQSAAAVWDRVLAAIGRRHDTLADQGGTSMVSAADAAGNVVVVIHSNSFPRFGSGIVVEPYALILNNRAGRGFTAASGHPNRPRAGRRPATTLHAWGWSDDAGRVRLLGGTPGGDNQMPWNAQLLTQLIGGETRPGILVAAPRWEWVPGGNGVKVEEGFAPTEVDALRARAAQVVDVPQWGLASAQQVIGRPVDGEALVAAVDPRTGGAVVGV